MHGIGVVNKRKRDCPRNLMYVTRLSRGKSMKTIDSIGSSLIFVDGEGSVGMVW